MEYLSLRNRVDMPKVGLGTWQLKDREQIRQLLRQAVDLGYQLIDTAAAYGNEISIGSAVTSLGISRDTLMLSDKLWNTCRGRQNAAEACKRSLKKLKTDYLDLYLIHWPASPKVHPDWAEINADTWMGLEDLYQQGYVRAIGVCNFKVRHLEELRKTAAILPMVNQVELHPGMAQEEILVYCAQEDICVQASSPLGNGQILGHPVLVKIAAQKGKPPAQICLRWAVQKGVAVIPKTASMQRLEENIAVFDFVLTSEEIREIDSIPYCGGIGIDSEEVTDFG